MLTNPDINSAARLGPKVALSHRDKDEQQRYETETADFSVELCKNHGLRVRVN